MNNRIQNRLISNNMSKELDVINISKNVAKKALRNESMCFRLKFAKHESAISPSGSEASDVKMYETHNPGFCFHRNGKYRKPSVKPETLNHRTILKVYPYIFTDGEVDPEKVVCLHLLTVHSLEMPSNLSLKKIINEVIFKSFEDDSEYNNCLPLFELESSYIQQQTNSNSDTEKELKLVNKRIKMLITMIINALKCTNPTKYCKIIEMVNNRKGIIKALNSRKIRELFQVCENSSILTDLRCYKLIDKNDFSTNCHRRSMERISMPKQCEEIERFIGHIRNLLLQEIKLLCQRIDSNETFSHPENEISKFYKRGGLDSSDGILSKREFFEKSESFFCSNGFVNNDSNSAEDTTKMTVYKLNNFNESMLREITQSKNKSKNNVGDDKSRTSAILNKMNNSQRIRVGNRVAQIKSKRVTQGLTEKKVSINGVLQEVLSKKSLENLFLSYCEQENDVFLKPLENYYSSNLKLKSEDQLTHFKKPFVKFNTTRNSAIPDVIQNNSCFLDAKIKQDIILKETNKRIKRFLQK